jgi:hypothetical protein
MVRIGGKLKSPPASCALKVVSEDVAWPDFVPQLFKPAGAVDE